MPSSSPLRPPPSKDPKFNFDIMYQYALENDCVLSHAPDPYLTFLIKIVILLVLFCLVIDTLAFLRRNNRTIK